ALRFCTDRRHLWRVAELGLPEVHVEAADKPILARDSKRQLVWVPLSTEGILTPPSRATRSALAETPKPVDLPQPPRREDPMTLPISTGAETNGVGARSMPAATTNGLQALIEEAEALKAVLRDAYQRTSHLVVALRRQKKESQLVRTTLASLRQLQG